MKNYYSILGVLPTAELVVIKAAYRALCQLHHPDRNLQEPARAHAITQELNEAWAILSDPQKRREFDEALQRQSGTLGDTGQAAENASFQTQLLELFPELQMALEYYPDLMQTVAQLARVSYALAIGFVAALLETKQFGQRKEIADALRQQFFVVYFGRNAAVLQFAHELIGAGCRDAALELNKAVNLFGDSIDASMVIERIKQKYRVADILKARQQEQYVQSEREWHLAQERKLAQRYETALQKLKAITANQRTHSAGELLKLAVPLMVKLRYRTDKEKQGTGWKSLFLPERIHIERDQNKWTFILDDESVFQWVKDVLVPTAEKELPGLSPD